MKLALISYEYPTDTGFGGIGTYTYQVAHMMVARGHTVEVFAGGIQREGLCEEEGVAVHRIKQKQGPAFQKAVAESLKKRFRKIKFDIIEGAEYKADALLVKQHLPDVPLVIKLHTPSYLLGRLFRGHVAVLDKARFMGGGILRGKFPKPYWTYDKKEDSEYHLTKIADGISSPSLDMVRIVSNDWGIPETDIQHLQNLFVPQPSFLDLPLPDLSKEKITITFIGKLERRKGIVELIEAAKTFLKEYPHIHLLLIGAYDHPSPKADQLLGDYIAEVLKPFWHRVKLTGPQPYDKMPAYLSRTAISLFPSLWENFPYVCLEAMSAGRAVIGSNAGGMAEMINNGEHGLLVSPKSPKEIISAINFLIENPEKVQDFGKKAREKILKDYNVEVIGRKTEEFYQKVIAKKQHA